MFLHDAILEGVTSGSTEVHVDKLNQKFVELEKVDADGESGFQKEYGVGVFICEDVYSAYLLSNSLCKCSLWY